MHERNTDLGVQVNFMPQKTLKRQDRDTKEIYKVLKNHFPELPDDMDKVIYRYNPASIRMRLIDGAFQGKSFGEREQLIEPLLETLPERIRTNITLLLLLTPKEAKNSDDLMNLEFDKPTGSLL
jgi:hypothetical protein